MTTTEWARERKLLRSAYRDFNARKIDKFVALLHPDVKWANGMEGGYVHGREGVRAYWTRQWSLVDPQIEPLRIGPDDQGRLVVEVHEVVRDLKGAVLVDTKVHHAYRFTDGLVERMDIE
jgi:SnoaL-like domain